MNGFTSLLWFAAVLAAIPLALWLLRRSPLVGAALTGPGAPRTVSVLALSPSQRLVTVEVGQGEERLWLVLGVTAQSIRTLHTMAPGAPLSAAPGAPAAAFSQLLGRLRQGPGSDAP
ncbi:MAG: flagellar biosynthetic protein FliO [Burkholderiales bacterium]|nr:flagellar biosynthetic protein FliO [Burkholderiales bacterium]